MVTRTNLGLVAASLLLLLAAPALARPVERSALVNLDGILNLGLTSYENDVLHVDLLTVLKLDVSLNSGYILKFLDKATNILLSIKSVLTDLVTGDDSVLKVNVEVFTGALLKLDAELGNLRILKVEVVDINGVKNYLYTCESGDKQFKQLVRAFVNCGRLHVVRAQCLAKDFDACLPLFRKSLLSYVIKTVVCLVKDVVGGLVGRRSALELLGLDLSLTSYANDVLSLDILNLLKLEVSLDSGYILKFVNKTTNILLSIKSVLTDLVTGDDSVLKVNVNVFTGALLKLDAELGNLRILKVEVLEINGVKNYLYTCESDDKQFKQLVRAFVNCGRLHVVRAQALAKDFDAILPLFRKSLLSYVIKTVVCLVKSVLGGIGLRR